MAAQSHVDVVIIGAGPSGLMLALWMAKLGVKTRVIDKRSRKVFSGQADGLQVRTLEILDSFGIGSQVWNEANHLIEICFWSADEQDKTRIRRDARLPDTMVGLSRFTQSVLHQGRIESYLLDAIRESECQPDNAQVKIDRSVVPTALRIDEALAVSNDDDAHPVEVTLRHLSDDESLVPQRLSDQPDGLHRSNLGDDDTPSLLGRSADRQGVEETVRAKYLVGCDGAHSWTRKTLGSGFEMVGESTDAIWGVLDIVPITDFPDIRNRCVVSSANAGTIMIIPREHRMVRLYVELAVVPEASTGRVDRSALTPQLILQTARDILHPYKLDYHYLDWWTAYQIGQRCGQRFSKLDRVFLAGDAVHTHSPKAGQGMNTSMQDTYNLGWKLGLVCKKMLQRSVLSTYELERRQVAQQLIAFDQKFSRLFLRQACRGKGRHNGELQDEVEGSQMFVTGVGICYPPSELVWPGDCLDSSKGSKQELATACRPGTRLASHRVLGQADARPWELHCLMPSDGRFRIFVFGGNVTPGGPQLALVNQLGQWLHTELLGRYRQMSLVAGHRMTPGWTKFPAQQALSLIDVVLVHTAPRDDVALDDLHPVYHPFDAKLGWDYNKTFIDAASYHDGYDKAYEKYGIDAHRGAMLVVRPDGHVGLVSSLDDEGRRKVGHWFDGVLRRHE
ncbi:hypothetical protein CDD81_2853 [Ophiocordyceps australis]|uniref:FAD-binding domain-containing protein n=1 Tax=Ophiocordyceps australis TaxID=1399860 RepID=A0A2C5XED8_9HYPO|nr:hypothetical protein CDD81_2853 [Ophiocordyceps australis]